MFAAMYAFPQSDERALARMVGGSFGKELRRSVDTYLGRTGMTPSRLGLEAVNNSKFVSERVSALEGVGAAETPPEIKRETAMRGTDRAPDRTTELESHAVPDKAMEAEGPSADGEQCGGGGIEFSVAWASMDGACELRVSR